MTKHGMLLRLAAVIATGSLTRSAVVAQTVPGVSETDQISKLPRRFASDEWRLWTSPFRKSPQRTQAIKKYVVPFALISGALIASDRQTGHLLPNTRDQMIWSGRVSQLGASYGLGGMAGGAYLLGKITRNDRLRSAGLRGLEALGHTQIAVFALKHATNRERPLDHDGKGGFWEGGNSFPSGHSAGAFAVATAFASEHRDRPVVPIAAYSLAAAVAASRVGARRHWVSDIAVGGSLGFLIGKFTCRRNHTQSVSGSGTEGRSRLMPQVGIRGSGILMSWKL